VPPTLGDYGLATWRACFYGLMYFHWRNSEVHTPPAYDPKMFGYDQFWWVPPLMPQDPAAVDACRELGGQLALLAAAGVAFPLTSGVYTLMAARHLFASITHFTNHNYLFVLLSLLTCCSGAGRTLSFDALLGPLTGGWLRCAPREDEPRYRGTTWLVVLMRLQLAVVYLFAFLWKLHPDWVSGQCCRLTFLSFEEQGAARGIPWHAIERAFPPVFQLLSVGGLFLDAGMLLSLALLRPHRATLPIICSFHLLFHGFTFVTMAKRIGFIFPAVMLCSELLLLPLDDAGDASLIVWVGRGLSGAPAARIGGSSTAGRVRRGIFGLYVLVQLGLPARMPLVSGLEFPRNALGYRFSWTMMLHATTHFAEFEVPRGSLVPREPIMWDSAVDPVLGTLPHTIRVGLSMFYFVPTCAGRGAIPRWAYLPDSVNVEHDSRTLPVEQIFHGRHKLVLTLFPRQLPKIMSGISESLSQVCATQVGVTAVAFVRLNSQGAFARLIDPTVDLREVNDALLRRSLPAMLWGAAFDRPPSAALEHILPRVGQSLGLGREEHLVQQAQRESGGFGSILLLDRAPCLAAQPLWLRPQLAARLWLKLHAAPAGCSLDVTGCAGPSPTSAKQEPLAKCMRLARLQPGQSSLLLAAYTLEISLQCGPRPGAAVSCRDAPEDVQIFVAALNGPGYDLMEGTDRYRTHTS